MRKQPLERPRHAREIQGGDEQGRVSDLPIPQEAPNLLVVRSPVVRRLLLVRAKRSKLTLSLDDLLHGGGTEGANELVLEVCVAHVEPELFHGGSSQVCAEAGPLEATAEVALLAGVTKARQPDAQPVRTETLQEASHGLRTPHRHDRDTLCLEIPTVTLGHRCDCGLIAEPFDEHDGLCGNALQWRLAGEPAVAATRRLRRRNVRVRDIAVLPLHSVRPAGSGGHRAPSFVHGRPALGVEEVESFRVDEQAKLFARACPRLRMDAGNEDRPGVTHRPDVRRRRP